MFYTELQWAGEWKTKQLTRLLSFLSICWAVNQLLGSCCWDYLNKRIARHHQTPEASSASCLHINFPDSCPPGVWMSKHFCLTNSVPIPELARPYLSPHSFSTSSQCKFFQTMIVLFFPLLDAKCLLTPERQACYLFHLARLQEV